MRAETGRTAFLLLPRRSGKTASAVETLYQRALRGDLPKRVFAPPAVIDLMRTEHPDVYARHEWKDVTELSGKEKRYFWEGRRR